METMICGWDAVTDNGLTTHSWNRGYDIGRG